jgi:general stress protein 26
MPKATEGTSDQTAPVEHLRKMLKGFDSAMLVTHGADGRMHSRPLAVADADDSVLYFATAIDSPKVKEIESDPRVNVCLQAGSRSVSIAGTAQVVIDPALVDRLWSEPWKLWFPKGKADPSLCLLKIEPEEAEYWDRSGAKGLRYIFQAAAAYVKGRQPASDQDQHAKVTP